MSTLSDYIAEFGQPPFRLRLLLGLTDVLKSITPANGYTNDLSDSLDDSGDPLVRVARGRVRFGDGDPIPLISILENPHVDAVDLSPGASTTALVEWNLLLQGWAKDDKVNPTDPAHWLLADVKRALVLEKKRLSPARSANVFGMGVKITELKIGDGVVRPSDEVSDKAYFWMPLTICMGEDRENPFA